MVLAMIYALNQLGHSTVAASTEPLINGSYTWMAAKLSGMKILPSNLECLVLCWHGFVKLE